MPHKIQIYTDETKSNDGSFIIYSMIYGKPDDISSLNDELKKIIHPDREKDNDFKGLHSHKLNDSNWNTLSKKFESSLDKLLEFFKLSKIGIKLCIIGSKKNENNTEFLKDLLKKELDNKDSKVKKIFESLEKKDHPALYHRLDQLFLYFLYRDRLGGEGTEFEFYPDSSGKILSYKDKKFRATGSDNQSTDLQFFEFVRVLGNTFAKVIGAMKFPGWSISKQELVKYDSLKWSDSYLIQLCDVLANFCFNHIRFLVGKTEKKYELKSNALTNRINLDNLNSKIKVGFQIKDGDVTCLNEYTLLIIDLDIK